MKNVVMIVVDQMRFDCLGINGNDQIYTPNLNMLASAGVNFENCYSAVPTCIAARAGLMTGLKQTNHKRVGYQDKVVWDYPKTIGSEFSKYGYQTQVIGKMHVYPERNRLGFDNVILHDGYLHTNRVNSGKSVLEYDDYVPQVNKLSRASIDLIDSGLDCNSWVARPWQNEERLHPTNWVTDNAIDFLKKRDPQNPFFLKVSYVRPHSPLDPPTDFWQMYEDLECDYPIGKWALDSPHDYSTITVESKLTTLEIKRMRQAYYGLISHIDNQIGRFLMALEESGQKGNTIIAFVSDHGDQLGEHNLFRKAFPYQGSVHVPFFIYDPTCNLKQKCDSKELVELRDIFPTLIDLAVNNEVTEIDGQSLIRDDKSSKEYIHGEHVFGKYSNHYIVTSKWKYIWFDQTGREQLFNLQDDVNECVDVSCDNPKKLEQLRNILIQELYNREEGYVEDNELRTGANRVAVLS